MKYCKSCPRADDPLVNPVPGFHLQPSSRETARVMIILESPTHIQVEHGDPLMDRDSIDDPEAVEDIGAIIVQLERWKIDPSEVFITYLQRCKPPKFSKIQATECYKTHVMPEIETVRPEILMLIGNNVLYTITGSRGILAKHGTVIRVEGSDTVLLPCIAPSYVRAMDGRRREDAQRMWVQAFQRLAGLLSGSDDDVNQNYHIVTGRDRSQLKELERYLLDHDFHMFDLETWPLKPWAEGAQILTAAWSAFEGEGWAVAYDHPEATWTSKDRRWLKDMIKAWASDRDKLKGAANAKFEIIWVREILGVELESVVVDPIVLDYLDDENRDHDVGAMAWRYTDLGGYDACMRDFRYRGKDGREQPDYRRAPLDLLARYNVTDTDVEIRSMNVLIDRLDATLKRVHDEILIPVAYTLATVEKNGWTVDIDQAIKIYEKYDQKLKDLHEELREDPVFRQFEEDQGKPFNFDSFPQKVKLFFGWDPKKHRKFDDAQNRYFDFPIDFNFMTKARHPSTDKNWRAANKHHQFVSVYDRYMKAWGLMKGFLKPLPDYIDNKDRRIHTDYNAAKVVSGRLSSTNPNTQNFPDDKEFWSIFISRWGKRGGRFVKADYSQVELRVLAWLSNDQPMIQTFKNGIDIHIQTTKEFLVISDEQWNAWDDKTRHYKRQWGKRMNFAVANDRGAHHLALDLTSLQREVSGDWSLVVTDEEAQEYIDRWYAPHEAILAWKEAEIAKAREVGYVESPQGYRRRAPDVNNRYDSHKRLAAERTLISFLMQSTAGVITLIAKTRIQELITEGNFKSKICGSVYDSIILDIRMDELDVLCSQIPDLMRQVGVDYGCPVPLAVDLEIGEDGGSLVAYDEVPF